MNILYEDCRKSDLQTIKIEFEKDGKTISRYIHSKYDPSKEAKQWAESIYSENKKTYIIYGGGLLYHIMELAKMIDNASKIFVFEPIQEIYDNNKSIDLFKENPNIIYTNSFNKDEITEMFYNITNDFDYNRYIIHIFQPYRDYNVDNIDIIYQAYKLNIYYSLMSFNTVEYSIDYMINNSLNNYKIFKENISINPYKNYFKGKTAVIVSAGPSLDKNIHNLKGYEDKVVIFTGGRSLRSLLNADIIPHFNASIDMKPENYELYKKYDILKENIPLITVTGNNSDILKNYKGIKIFSNSTEDINEKDFENWYERDTDSLYVSGTVATLQVSAAIYMGFKKIIFIGQDLAYTDNKFHADTASNNNNKVGTNNDGLFYVKGNYEEKVLTKGDLNLFRTSFQQAIKNLYPKDCTFINATEGGAFIEGTEIMTLKEALNNLKDTEITNDTSYKKILNIYNDSIEKPDYMNMYNKMYKLLKDMKKIQNLSKNGINISENLKIFKTSYNSQYLKQLDKIDEKIKKYEMASNFIKRFKISFSIDVLGKESDTPENIVKNVKKMYKDTNKISNIYIKYLEKELKELNKFKNNEIEII